VTVRWLECEGYRGGKEEKGRGGPSRYANLAKYGASPQEKEQFHRSDGKKKGEEFLA